MSSDLYVEVFLSAGESSIPHFSHTCMKLVIILVVDAVKHEDSTLVPMCNRSMSAHEQIF